MPVAIEVFDDGKDSASVRIDINGSPFAQVEARDLPHKLAEIGRAYADGDLVRLLRDRPAAK
jgi:hypothetical protein